MSAKRNPVAKNTHRFNKPKVETDRKKASKRGYRKHAPKDQEAA